MSNAARAGFTEEQLAWIDRWVNERGGGLSMVGGPKSFASGGRRGTVLEKMYLEGRYNPLSEEEAVDATLAILEVLPPPLVIHRMTSNPHAEELIAPSWMLDSRGIRNRLFKTIEARDLRQGRRAAEKDRISQ